MRILAPVLVLFALFVAGVRAETPADGDHDSWQIVVVFPDGHRMRWVQQTFSSRDHCEAAILEDDGNDDSFQKAYEDLRGFLKEGGMPDQVIDNAQVQCEVAPHNNPFGGRGA